MNTTATQAARHIGYGFAATMTAAPGRGDELIARLAEGTLPGNPAASEHCIVYLISRSVENPDLVHVVEGWTTIEDHHREFDSEAARAIVASLQPLIAEASPYTDFTPVAGKAF